MFLRQGEKMGKRAGIAMDIMMGIEMGRALANQFFKADELLVQSFSDLTRLPAGFQFVCKIRVQAQAQIRHQAAQLGGLATSSCLHK